MADLKKAWVKTAKSLVLAANDLGIALVDTVKAGRDKAVEWANTSDEPIETEGKEVPAEDPADNKDS